MVIAVNELNNYDIASYLDWMPHNSCGSAWSHKTKT